MNAPTPRKPVRLFLALWPDPAVRAHLAEVAAGLKPAVAGRWTRAENFHVTLVFIGAVGTERLVDVRRIAAATNGHRFRLKLDHGEFWPRAGIVCLAPDQAPAALAELAGDLAARLRDAGFPLERRPYRPHLTVARNGRAPSKRLDLPQPIVWEVDGFCLVESTPAAGGSIYRVLADWTLAPPPP